MTDFIRNAQPVEIIDDMITIVEQYADSQWGYQRKWVFKKSDDGTGAHVMICRDADGMDLLDKELGGHPPVPPQVKTIVEKWLSA